MKRKLADVLWDAANKWLGDGQTRGCSFSCHAVDKALNGRIVVPFTKDMDSEVEPWPFLRAMGSQQAHEVLYHLYGDRDFDARQGVRYMWLLLAMHVAEDEGIEIEVSA